MATITSLGSGSGLDLEGLVTKLMQVERQPLTALQTQSSKLSTKISALGTLSSKLSALQTAAKALMPATLQTPLDKFASYTGTVADTTIASATVGSGAVAGKYSLEVSQLAQGQKLTSTAFSSSQTFGTGTLTLSLGDMSGTGGTFKADSTRTANITITSENNTLSGIRNAINAANLGVSATIINGSAGAQLVLTGAEGANQVFKLDGISDLAFNPDAPTANSNIARDLTAQGAAFSLNGIAATSNTNTVTGVLDGVTLNLTKTTTSATTLTITKDNTTNLKSALDSFIKAYNDAASTMKTQGAYDASTKTAGSLQGNRVLREAQTTLSSLLYDTSTGGSSPYQRLADIGVSLGDDGQLKLDSSKLNTAVTADASTVASLVAKVGSAFNDKIENIVGLTGSIKGATDTMNLQVKDLSSRQDALQRRLTSVEARYRSQFSALDTLMSQMNTTSSYLTKQLSSSA